MSECESDYLVRNLRLQEELAQLKQREMVLTAALRNIMDDQRAEENRYVFLTAKQALSDTKSQTADQVLRWHVEWMSTLDKVWMTPESKYRLTYGGNCKGAVPVHLKSSHTATIPLVAIPTLPDSAASPETDLDKALRHQ